MLTSGAGGASRGITAITTIDVLPVTEQHTPGVSLLEDYRCRQQVMARSRSLLLALTTWAWRMR